MRLKKIFHKNIKILVGLLILSYSAFSFAQDNDIDAQISNILKASPTEKEQLIKELKNNVSEIKYNNTENKEKYIQSKTIDEKIENRKSKSIPMSKCGPGKCGMSKCGRGKCGMSNKFKPGTSHGSKCGTSNTKCGGGSSHGSKCGMGN